MSQGLIPKSPLIVQSLVGRSALPFYVRCLQSLLKHCGEKISLLLHEDGSLEENDREQAIKQLGENSKFAAHEETTEKTLDQLSGYPHCQAIRKNSLWGTEFFDPLFAQPENPISYYIDADILFIRPFCGLFDPKEVRGGALFLGDVQWDAYSLRPWHLLGFGLHPEITKGITTALVCWDKRVIDWDYLEWFLSQSKFHCIPEWLMPTCQAGLAKRCRARVVSPNQLPNLYPNASIGNTTLGVHMLGSYRTQWQPKVDSYVKEMPREKVQTKVIFEPCQSRGALAYGLNQAKRWINTRLNKW